MTVIVPDKKIRILKFIFIIMSLFGLILFSSNLQNEISIPIPLFSVSMNLLGNALFMNKVSGYLSLLSLLVLVISIVSFLIKKSRIKLFLNFIFFIFCFSDIFILLILYFSRDTLDLAYVLLSVLTDILYAGIAVAISRVKKTVDGSVS